MSYTLKRSVSVEAFETISNLRLPLTEFTLFSNLPIEIRLKIFEIAHLEDTKDRVVEVTCKSTINRLICRSLAPSFTRVSRESREETLHNLKQLPTTADAVPIYLDVDKDTCLILDPRNKLARSGNHLFFEVFGNTPNMFGTSKPIYDLSFLKHLCIECWALVSNDEIRYADSLGGLAHLQSFSIVVGGEIENSFEKCAINIAKQPSDPSNLKILTNPSRYPNISNKLGDRIARFWGLAGPTMQCTIQYLFYGIHWNTSAGLENAQKGEKRKGSLSQPWSIFHCLVDDDFGSYRLDSTPIRFYGSSEQIVTLFNGSSGP